MLHGSSARISMSAATLALLSCLTLLPVACAPTSQSSAQHSQSQLADIARFFEDASIVAAPAIVDCTLSGGAVTQCFSITVRAQPGTHSQGPWCPNNVADGPEVSGVWPEGGELHDADGAFMAGLSRFYGDDNWRMVDPQTGAINVTDTVQACQAAARPDVDPAYRNYCVQCLPEYVSAEAATTYVIPLDPRPIGNPSPARAAGLAFTGVRLDGPAPADRILAAYTIAPFDDCGGHINPNEGYHYHAVTDCLSSAAPSDAHGSQIGFALDGYKIYAHHLGDGADPQDLDRCNGHLTDGFGYHYHAGEPGSNAILGCLSAERGCVMENGDQLCDASAERGPPPL